MKKLQFFLKTEQKNLIEKEVIEKRLQKMELNAKFSSTLSAAVL